MISDPLAARTVLHRDLVRRQLDVAVPDHDRTGSDRARRLAEGHTKGLDTLRRLLTEERVPENVISGVWECATSDPRFSFIRRLPASSAFGSAAARAMGHAFHGDSASASVDLSALVNASITLLDGLLDNAQDLFESGEDRVRELLEGLISPASSARDPDEATFSDHPVLILTLRVIRGSIRRASRCRALMEDSSFHEAFYQAARRALEAEVEATQTQVLHTDTNLGAVSRSLPAKSANALWLLALAGLSNSGWPEDTDLQELQKAMEQLGRYFGWIDDVVDFLEDLDAGRWNQVHLTVIDHRQGWGGLDRPTLAYWLSAQLSNNRLTEQITRITLRERSLASEAFVPLTSRPEWIEELISDASYSWLTEGA